MFVLKGKLLFKIWKFPFLSETFVLEQILTAIYCGYEVRILVEELQDIKENKLEEFFKENDILNNIIIEDYSIPSGKLSRLLKFLYLFFINIFELHKLIQVLNQFKWDPNQIFKYHFYRQFRDYEIIHVQYGTNVKPLDLFKKLGLIKAKLIVSFHGHDAFFPINGIIPNNGYYNDLFKYGDLIVANTQYLAKVLLGLGCEQDKLKTIPVGVNTEYFTPSTADSSKDGIIRIISVGRLDKVKGQSYAIEMVRRLKNKGYNVRLSILGEGVERQNLEELIHKYELGNEVILKGKKNRQEVKASLIEHDIFVLPAVAVDNDRRETQGLAALEAQACGLPAVVFDSGGVKYTVLDGETGFVVPEYNVEIMTSKIEELIINNELRRNMGQRAVEFVTAEFSQNELRKLWCEVYSRILKDG